MAGADGLRRALGVLSRDELSAITEKLELPVADRRSAAAHVEAICGKAGFDLGALLGGLRRERLKEICRELGLDDGGKEKAAILGRIAGTIGATPPPLTLTPPEPAKGGGKTRALPLELGSTDPARPSPRGPHQVSDVVAAYRHDETRKNNPPAGLIEFDRPPPQPKKSYRYDPHLDPQLQWAGKAEHTSFDVDTVSLHIHEVVAPEAILRAVKREDAQRSLFGETPLAESKQVDFYRHEVDWRNRLVLGDSLVVMNSLLEREQMAGKVQCVYLDPPYGVKFNSNFQPSISRRDVKDGDDGSLTREPEQIQAYRDTWTLGVHSYLTYLRDRLLLARELLHESGSIFVQISDENVHHVRELMDEVFGAANYAGQIVAQKTGGLGTSGIKSIADYLLWYAKDRPNLKYRKLFREKLAGIGEGTGERYDQERDGRPYQLTSLTSGAFRENTTVPFEFDGEVFHPGQNACWKTTVEGMKRLEAAGRIEKAGKTIRYVRFLDDFPAYEITNVWDDIAGAPDKVYVVQTSPSLSARCLLMTTDPGDLVLDPTCGSGTTAYVAEQWGRRWITCDTSRVALSIARQRLMTTKYPYFRLRSDRVRDGFVYKTVPHVTLKSLAQNQKLDGCKTQEERERVIRESAEQEILYDQPEEAKSRVRVSGPFTVEAIPVATLEAAGDSPIASTAAGHDDYLQMMLDLLRKTGIHFPTGKTLTLSNLRSVRGHADWLHAEGESEAGGETRRVAISFGPRHAPVTPKQVIDAIREARGYDLLVFVGFAQDPEAGRIIEAGTQHCELHFAHAAPDLLVGDLLKTTKTTKLFTVFGAPDVKVEKAGPGEVSVELCGVDLYDPQTGETQHDPGSHVAAWFLDHDYDGKSFCICQAFFPAGATKDPWEKLQRALKGQIDEEKFEALRGTKSLPFKPGKKIAVKVVDDRGNEVVKVVEGR